MSDTNVQTWTGTLAAPAAPLRRWLALPVILAGTFMVTLDFFIVNVAIPSIQRELHASAAAVEWVVAGYGLAYAALLIIGGRLGDMFGRRRMFCLGLTGFTLASAACGVAPGPTVLVLARIDQGVGAALLAPQVLALLGTIYTGVDRPRAFAVFGLVLGLAAALGQLIGGLLIRADLLQLGWRVCFLVNLPVGVAALLLAPLVVPESRAEDQRGTDLAGAALLTAGITLVLLPLIEGRATGWPLWTWASFAGAVLLLGGFLLQQRRRTRAGKVVLISPVLWRAANFRWGLLGVLSLYGGVASFFLVLALYLQVGRGLGALESGLVFSVLAVGFCATSLRAGRIAQWLGRPTLTIGALGMALGLAILRAQIGWSGSGAASVLWLVPALLLDGAGMGLVMAPLIATALAGLPARDGGAAAGVLASVQQFANALGVALIGLVYFGPAHGAVTLGSETGGFVASLDGLVVLAVVLALVVRRLR